MGIRETLNRNQTLTTGVTVAIIIVALIIIVMQLTGGGSGSAAVYTKWYYSTNEDGSNWFEDDINKIAPFDHNGKPAYKVFLYTCDGGKTKFVGYLERFTEAGKKKAEALRNNPQAARDPAEMDMLQMTEVEIKSPTGKWLKRSDPKAEEVMGSIKCPDGTTNKLEIVAPD
jgi:hypothetical protein